jgi:hypothetical protein
MDYKFTYKLMIDGKITIPAKTKQEADAIFNTMSVEDLIKHNAAYHFEKKSSN